LNYFVLFWTKRILKNKNIFLGNLILIILITVPLVCSLVFVNSMIDGITNKYIFLSDGHISISSSNNLIINENEGIISTNLVEKLFCVVYSKTDTSNVIVKGVQPDYFNDIRSQEINFESETSEEGSLNSVYISRTLADKLSLSVGDKMAMMIMNSTNNVVRPVIVKVGRIFTTGYDQLDSNLIFTNYEYAKSLTKKTTFNYEIICNTNDVNELTKIANQIQDDNPEFSYNTWNQLNESVYSNFINSQQIIFIIFALIIIMASFYSANVAHSTIQKNFTAIAILKILGTSDKKIKQTTFLSVFSITFLGNIIGIILGILLSYSLNPLLFWLSTKGIDAFSFYLLDFTLIIPYTRLILFCLFMLVVSSISILYSLRIVKKISPMRLFQST